MIKKFIEFIKENSENKTEKDFNSLGEWIEYLFDFYKNDDEKLSNLKSVINRNFNIYREDDLNDIKSDIRLANAINILDDKTKSEISSLISKFIEGELEEKDPVVDFSTDLEPLTESDITLSGKGVFTSFLKSLTALGQKDIPANLDKTPDDYLFYYHYDLKSEDVKSIFKRFASLNRYVNFISYDKNEIELYFGVKCDGEFEYGIFNGNYQPIGKFKLTSGVIKWVLGLELKSAYNLKKNLVNYNYNDLITIGRIKKDLIEYNPGFFENKSKISINDRIVSIAYQGIGKWDNGQLDIGEFQNLKNNFNNWIITKRWSDKVQFGIKPSSYWVHFNLKIK